jgi:hypothetical protein
MVFTRSFVAYGRRRWGRSDQLRAQAEDGVKLDGVSVWGAKIGVLPAITALAGREPNFGTPQAQALGCGRDFFDKRIGPELRSVRRGRLKFVAIAEIEDWLRRNAALTL